jgi:hypothetical protein
MTDEMQKKQSLPKSMYCPGVCMIRPTKTMKSLSQGCRCPDRDSNRKAPEYKPRALPLYQPVGGRAEYNRL